MTSSFAELEPAKPITKRRSRRMRYVAVIGLCLVLVSITMFVLNNRTLAQAQRRALAYANQGGAQRYVVQAGPALTYAQNSYPQNTYPQNTYPQNAYSQALPSQNAYPQNTYSQALPSQNATTGWMNSGTGVLSPQSQPLDPAEATMTAEITRLRDQIRSWSGDQKESLQTPLKKAALSETVSKLFDLRHAAQAKQVEKLEAELASAKELHRKRGERKNEIVERRIAELLEAADDLAWNRDLRSGAPISSAPAQSFQLNSVPSNYVPNLNGPLSTHSSSLPSQPVAPGQSPSFTPPSYDSTAFPGQNAQLSPIPLRKNNSSAVAQAGDPILATATNSLDGNQAQPSLPSLATTPTNKLGGDVSSVADKPSIAEVVFGGARSVIEAGYELEAALERAIRTDTLTRRGIIGSDQAFEADRAAAKGQAIWTNLKSQLQSAEQLAQKQLVLLNQTLGAVNVSDQVRKETLMQISRLESEVESLRNSSTWAENFESESLAPLQAEFSKLKQKDGQPAKNANEMNKDAKTDEAADAKETAEAEAVLQDNAAEAKPTAEVDEVKY